MSKRVFRVNNFDMLRLFAALQVAVNHAVYIMHVDMIGGFGMVLHFSYLFSGVPIFFFISGYLISKSFEKNHRLSEYFQNRVLRLYPGLVACVTLSFLLIAISGYMATTDTGVLDWTILFLAKTTILQFYNPDFMRAYGDGVLNGSLWTITVEIQFYILIPIIYHLFRLNNTKKYNNVLLGLIVTFLAINRIFAYTPIEYQHTILYKLINVSFLPWFYMFLVGVWVQKNFEYFYNLLAGKILLILPIYLIIGYFVVINDIELGNNINPIVFVALVATVFSFAYSYPRLNEHVLRGNDISYGVYIYHIPIVNFLIYSGFSEKLSYSIYALLIAISLALISWLVIERTSLRLKKHPLNPLNKPHLSSN